MSYQPKLFPPSPVSPRAGPCFHTISAKKRRMMACSNPLLVDAGTPRRCYVEMRTFE